ncbi:integrase [Thermoplasma sp. Kam2015]|uniref:site-specific integrase n=1 Tax=Thermoplasma sp. Kam2015 TaxID=2094122 RepID=UPI000D93F105|nr:site-specific integrase [Thermoplasma sp. Kam2015]PYB68567.1 integrase [Thermoplasma sp. Kam2015]
MDPILIEFKEPKHRERLGRTVLEEEPRRSNVVQMKTRILRPSEYEALRSAASPKYRVVFDTALMTGMRVVELRLFLKNPSWFDGTFIHLPRIAIKKKKATINQRWIHLSSRGRALIENIHQILGEADLPTETSLRDYMHRKALIAGIDPYGLNMKMFRKTWESWLIASYPDRKEEIFLSQGHTSLTALQHYVNLPFTEEDRLKMKEWVEGWR